MYTLNEYLIEAKQVRRDYSTDSYYNTCNFCKIEHSMELSLYWYYEGQGRYRACAICYIELMRDDCPDCSSAPGYYVCDEHDPVEHSALEVTQEERIIYNPSDSLMRVVHWEIEQRKGRQRGD